jgi:hypothetical protein
MADHLRRKRVRAGRAQAPRLTSERYNIREDYYISLQQDPFLVHFAESLRKIAGHKLKAEP